ncbi:putative ABC transport system permease protein [Filimonas lacunae]|uniref:Putative ABC transport system permease protein n=1 Tax=Filimonas lacunae TaxID=477680 RepID=A0A173MEH7_9BACT|nr:ABC transporter permease [Filimonas lacunae]BAV06002.1 ABC transporter, permease protein [Filimonas lacunae]SIT24135.1 putative ABC transport system permease protein [Filimonas lacunae]
MLRHYFQIAWRNIRKRKFFSLLNVTGLAIGMVCCLLITLYLHNELSYDQYHTKHDRIYRLVHAYPGADQRSAQAVLTPKDYQVWGCAPAGPALQANFPGIEKVVRFTSPSSWLLQYGEQRIQQDNMVFMDSTAFDVFSWEWLYGNRHTALVAPGSIVLTQSVAKKFFGNTDPVGKTLLADNQENLLVTGVIKDVPPNSQFTFNGLISMTTMRKYRPEIFSNWGYVDFYTYLLLKENAQIASIETKLPAFIRRYTGPDRWYGLTFEKMTDAYLHSVASRQPGATGSLLNIYLFACIAVFIMLIACINFINLSTARSLERAKEVGVRKVLGVRVSSLVWQFLLESVLFTLAAAVIALILARPGIVLMEKLSGKDISYTHFFTPLFFAGMFLFSVVVGMLAGIYPALALVKVKAIAVLKGRYWPIAGGVSLRKVLVVFQFALSVALIAGTLVVYAQLQYLGHRDLGFQKEQMVILDFAGDAKVQQNIESIKRAIAAQPGVTAVTASRAVPGEFLPNAGTEIQAPDGQLVQRLPLIYEIDFDFIPTYHIPLVAGRAYSREHVTDSAEAMIINEATAQLFGYTHPADAVGKQFQQWGRKGVVIGVVKNFHFRSLHQAVEPLTLRYGYPSDLNRISVSIKGDAMQASLAGVKKVWDQMAPQRPFLFHFLDESFREQYQADEHFGQLFTFFSCLAICIACLGLLGLSTYMAQQRVKEIGVRKVLGSSVAGIVLLLSKDFISLVFIAIIIAVPICVWAMNQWLHDFAYRITIGPLVFIEAGLLTLGVAFTTIAWQSVKAAIANPIQSLRHE